MQARQPSARWLIWLFSAAGVFQFDPARGHRKGLPVIFTSLIWRPDMTLTLFERALVAHLIADWLLQNNWMAKNKYSLVHPAAWIHASIYAASLALAIGWPAGLTLGLLHLIIDTGIPLQWWTHI